MKKLLPLLALALLIIGACNKDKNGNDTLSSASWYLKTVKYTSTTVSKSTTGEPYLLAETSDGNTSIQVFFKTLPTANGTYTIVSENKAAHNTLGDNECTIQINVGSSDAYLSSGMENAIATVTTNVGGQIEIDFPTIQVIKPANYPVVVDDTTTGGNGNIIESFI